MVSQQNSQDDFLERLLPRNSVKLNETLSELEAALQAWDRVGNEPSNGAVTSGVSLSSDGTALNENAPSKRAQDLLRQLREQIEDLSED